MSDKTLDVIDVNKPDGKPTMKFGSDFLSAFSQSLTIYDDTLDELESIVKGNGITEAYGICNTRYQMIYITPKDIASYISYLFKAISKRLIGCNAPDLEKLSVELAKQFVLDNGGPKLCRDNMFATSTYVDPRTQTLMDILVQTQNTFFDRAVYSKYELSERTKSMKDDFNTINGMHFAAAMKAVVNALPTTIVDTMKESLRDDFVVCNCDLVMKYIETFILFVCSLNTCTLNQMIAYAKPRSTFKVIDKADEKFTTESFSIREYAPMFIILSSGNSMLSGPIKKITKSKWSHCSLAFDPELKEMFSYGARLQDDPDHPNRMSMKRESLQASNLADKEICVFGFYIPKDAQYMIHKEALHRYDDRDNSKFDLALLIKKAFNDDTTGSTDDTKKICTTFTNDLIKMCGKAFSDKAVPSPQQMKDAAELTPEQCKLVFEGMAADYDGADVNKKMKSFARTKVSKPFVEYVTECAIIKTNDLNIRARIPFDCNMRNIVLQDVTPSFKDTMSALHFMVDSPRSPIHVLLVKYATMTKLPGAIECQPTIDMLKPYFYHCDGCTGWNDNGRAFLEDRAEFLTDVNWLDKIAYGNQFMDGNYRLDAVGNETRHPLVQTLCNLHRMYCGCTLKSNDDIANNILRIVGVMRCVIQNAESSKDRQNVTDILTTLGDCFTRNVLKLYYNNCTVITYDDDMCDSMIPGYTYCEQYVFMEEENGPSVEIGGKPLNTAPKNAVLNKLTTMIRQFGDWIQKKFANVPNSFLSLNNAKIAWIKAHDSINKEVGQAISANTFQPTLKNFPIYKVPAKDMIQKAENTQSALQELLGKYLNNNDGNTDQAAMVKEIKQKLYPGNDAIANQIAEAPDDKTASQMIENYILYGKTNPAENETSYNGAMTADQWNDMVSNLLNSQKLVEQATKSMTKSLQAALKVVDNQMKAEEKAAASPKPVNEAEQPAQKSNAQVMFDTLTEISKNYQINAINIITKKFFNTNYDAYKKIVDAWQSQKKNGPVQQTNQQPAQQTQQNPGQPAEAAAANPATPTENPTAQKTE